MIFNLCIRAPNPNKPLNRKKLKKREIGGGKRWDREKWPMAEET